MAKQVGDIIFSHEEPTPQDSAGWEAWTAERLAETIGGYRAKPDLLRRDANAEKSITSDYAGRELFELVQNAADAAAEFEAQGRVLIEVRDGGVCVANTGMTFRAGGVRSLMTAHISDKPERGAALIGAKGLGFRAILNWSSEPFVTSGAVEIGFSRKHAAEQVDALASSDDRIAAMIARSTRPFVPILPFPVVGAALDEHGDAAREKLISRARALRARGYDTVIAAPFDNGKLLARALAQLAEFEPDFLLFVEALDQIIIDPGDGPIRSWTKNKNGPDQFTLEIADGEVVTAQDWFCGRSTGTLADPESPGETRAYQLAVALHQDGPTPPGKLHCYFPTDVPVPLPAILHATLDLDSSRKLLNAESELNAGVLAALARFYADYLLTLRDRAGAPRSLSLLSRSASFPETLETFETQLYQAARSRQLIPTNGGSYATAAETRAEPSTFAAHLPARFFPTLARRESEEDRAVIGRLKVDTLKQEEIVSVLRRAEMTISERAAAIVGIARTLPSTFHDRTLLLDTEGHPLTSNNSSFPPPTSGAPPKLPWWAKAKFLHPELWSMVSVGLGGAMRDRYEKLQHFGVGEFSAAGVIGSLRRHSVTAIRRDPEAADTIRLEFLQALFDLRQSAVARDALFPPGSTDVLCADGAWRDATAAHFSAGYGGTGPILSALYNGDPARLLANPKTIGLSDKIEALAAFFRWIGVHSWPRRVQEMVPVVYRPLVIAALPETFDVVEGIHRRSIKRSELHWGSTCNAEYSNVAGLADILSHAPSAAILAWLALDPRFDNVQPATFPTSFRAKSGSAAFKPYLGPLPDIVRHMLSTRKWLLTVDGERVAPGDAMISPGPLAALFKTPRRPVQSEEQQFALTRAMWVRGLINARVPDRLSDLDEQQIYSLLESLKGRNVSSDVVRRLYGQILQIDEFDPTLGRDAGKRFRKSGTVQVRMAGVVSWAPVQDALYLDRDNFPTAARDHLALLDVPARRSASAIESRFGVRPLSRQNFSLTVSRVVEDEGLIAGHLRTRFQDSLRFIQTLRHANSVDTAKLARLEQILLVIVREATLAFSLGSEVFDGALDPGKYLLDGDSLLVCIDPDESDEEIVMRALTAISDGLAEFFELQSGDDFEKLLLAGTNSLRMLQLRRLLGNQTSEEIEVLLGAIEAEVAAPTDTYAVDAATLAMAMAPPAPPNLPPVPTPAAAENAAPADPIANAPSPPAANPETAQAVPAQPAPLQTPQPQPVPPQPIEIPRATAVLVTKLDAPTTGGAGGGRGGGSGLRIGAFPGAYQSHGDVLAPNDAEEWAMLFEESERRFPIRVSRLQGTGSYGCDCLSFASDADREVFKAAPESNVGMIARFIEVKSGAVKLTRTEQLSAQRNRKRYFIYQVLFDSQGRLTAHLNIVSDPLAYRTALVRECEVRLDLIPNRDRRKLSAIAT